MSNHCNILIKKTSIPPGLEEFLRPGDVLFEHADIFVVVDDENQLDYPYEYEIPIEIVRLDKDVLKELNDTELAIVLFRAKIEREAYLICGDIELAIQNADYILEQRYPTSALNSTAEKLSKIYS